MNTTFNILAQGSAGAGLLQFTPFILMILIFWVLIIRPQQKRQKQLKAEIDALKNNDKVVTIGGMHGIVLEIGETTFTLKTEDGTRIEFDKSAVARVVK